MFNYKAYELGSKVSYPVTQIRWDGNEKHIAFNGIWHKEDECVLCAGTATKDSDGNEIYEGDILQLNIYDDSCYYKGKIGIVSFYEGRFSWSPIDGWGTYSLAGKSWKRIGNIAHVKDVVKFYTDEQIKRNSKVSGMLKMLFDHSKGVLVEKYTPIIKESIELPYINSIAQSADKQKKTLLHQYKNYLKIKSMIETGEINTKIMDSNLGLIKNKEIVKNDKIS